MCGRCCTISPWWRPPSRRSAWAQSRQALLVHKVVPRWRCCLPSFFRKRRKFVPDLTYAVICRSNTHPDPFDKIFWARSLVELHSPTDLFCMQVHASPVCELCRILKKISFLIPLKYGGVCCPSVEDRLKRRVGNLQKYMRSIVLFNRCLLYCRPEVSST